MHGGGSAHEEADQLVLVGSGGVTAHELPQPQIQCDWSNSSFYNHPKAKLIQSGMRVRTRHSLHFVVPELNVAQTEVAKDFSLLEGRGPPQTLLAKLLAWSDDKLTFWIFDCACGKVSAHLRCFLCVTTTELPRRCSWESGWHKIVYWKCVSW